MALPVLTEFEDEAVARCLELVKGRLPNLLSQAQERLAEANSAQETYAQAGRHVEAAVAKVSAGDALIGLGRGEEAVALFSSARDAHEGAHLDFEAAACSEKLGLAFDAMGKWIEAAASYRSAAAAYAALKADLLQIEAWGGAKAAHASAGEMLEAAQAEQALAETLARANREWEALDAYRHAALSFARLDELLEAARCQVGVGQALAHLDRHQHALGVLKAAKEDLAWAHQVLEVALCERILGEVWAALGQYDTAQEVLETAKAVLEEAGRRQEVADCDLALAWVHLADSEPRLALKRVEAAMEGFDQDAAVVACELVRGRALIALDRPDEAFDAAYEARSFFLAARLGLRVALADEVLTEAHLGMAGQAKTEAEASRHRRAALDGTLRAVGVIDAHRYQLHDPSLRSSWTEAHGAAYARAFSLAQDHAHKPRLAQLVKSARIQGLSARQQAADLWTAVGPRAGARAEQATAEPISMDEEASGKADALAQAGEAVPLGAPAAVVLAGTPPLADEVGRRRVALEHVLAQAGGEGAWWWGSRVSGDVLYWSLLGPKEEVVDAGAIAMADLAPLLARLAQALPQRLEGETTDQALDRALGGAMADRSLEAALAVELGSVLIPPPLGQHLADASHEHPLSLVVAPAPELGRVPFALLGLDDADQPLRLAERAVVRLGASAALLEAVSSRERSRPGGAPGANARMLSVVDPGSQGLFRDGVPGAWGQAVLSRPENLEALSAKGFACEMATKHALVDRLGQGFDVLAFLGHARPGPKGFPADAHLELWDQVVTARDWLYDPHSWAVPARVGLLACGSGGAESPEWLGLAPAALSAGARVVMATAWNLPNDKAGDTWVLADQVVRVLRDSEDPAASWRKLLLDHLRHWRRGTHNPLSPLLWGAIQVVGLAG
ncbi:MAG TPA: hypothetical protein VK988_22205 [Acidimicrobiales bacterium]|nr:hypothetical protein [Acidimicrobiales bacterium]